MMKNGFLFTPEVANAWKSAWASVGTDMNHCGRRVRDASTSSQLQCKLWIVNELSELMLFPKSVVLLGGWYANFIVPLLIEHGVSNITNFDLDPDVKKLSYKFNKTYKDDEIYKCYLANVMFEPIFNIKFKNKPEIAKANVFALQAGYNYAITTELFQARYNVPPAVLPSGEYRQITGNQAFSLGCVAASLRSGLSLLYSSYPITPASDISLGRAPEQ